MLLTWIAAGLAALTGGWAASELRPAAIAKRRAARAVRRVEKERRAQEALRRKVQKPLVREAGHWSKAAARDRFRSRPIEDLKEVGADNVRWSALRAAGYTTVGDLRGVPERKLVALDGVGEVSAARVVKAVAELERADRSEPVAPPPVQGGGPDRTRLIGAARDELTVEDVCGEVTSQLTEATRGLNARLAGVKRKASLFARPFGERRRLHEEAIDEAERLAADATALQGEDALVGRSRRARAEAVRTMRARPSPEELLRDHEARFARYSAVIEEALDAHRGIEAPPGAYGGLPDEIAARVEAFELDTERLSATLRGYQAFGAKYALVQRRVLLGDEMGLGKTMQALAAMAHLSARDGARHFLVVAPATLLANWARETEKHTRLAAFVLHGPERAKRLDRWVDEGGVAVTSFETLRRLPLVAGDEPSEHPLAQLPVDVVVVDEAHYVKNPDTNRTKAVREVADRARHVLFLTGTPLENRVDEFRRLVGMLREDLSMQLDDGDPAGRSLARESAFRRAVAPVYLRRNQRDVLRELPERVEKEEWVQLSKADTAAYRDAVMKREIMAMRRAATVGEWTRSEDAGKPSSAKLERLAELLAEYAAEGEKVLLFSFFLDVIEAVDRRFGAFARITGEVPAEKRQGICDEFAAHEGHALLVMQIQAAGVGLNLQAASVVVLTEPQWKPSTEEQAVARAHRMGQARTVMVHRLLAADSVDERMREALADKRELFDAFARESSVRDATEAATETEMVEAVIAAEVQRLGGAA